MKKNFLHSKSIFWQLVVFALLISLIPILIISTFLFQKLEGMVIEEMRDYHGQISSQYTKNIEEKLEQYQDSLQYISNNTMIMNTLMEKEGNPYLRGEVISGEVAKSLLLEEQSEIYNCMIYSMVEDIPVYGTSVTMIDEGVRESWYGEERMQDNQWFAYKVKDKNRSVLSLVKDIEQVDLNSFAKDTIGKVKLDISINRLFAPTVMEGEEGASYDVIVFDENKKVFYTTDRKNTKILNEYLKKQEQEKVQPEEIGTYVVEETDLDMYGLRILLLFDNKELIERQAEVQRLVFPILIIMILLVVGCAYFYSRDFSSRVACLVQKFKRAETGDMTIQNPIEGNDEISVLDRQFSHMLMKLDQLIKTNYIQQLENKEAQLRNLQLQINPHFLYNTLETISSIAAVKQAFVVCDMCQKLGAIFRYSLGKDYGEVVTLEQELEHMQNYIFIQKIRYGSRLEVFYNVEVDASQFRIPRFILQPIVENAILHGLGELTGTGTLEISVYEQDGKLLIKIADDGVGMDGEKVAELNEYINAAKDQKDSKKSIGIRNVNQRIKLSCGEEYGVTITSYPYQGSCFSLWLPIIKGGTKDET